MAARPWFRLRSTVGQAPPPSPGPLQTDPTPAPQPRPAFGRAMTFRPTLAPPPPPPPPPPPATASPPPPSPPVIKPPTPPPADSSPPAATQLSPRAPTRAATNHSPTVRSPPMMATPIATTPRTSPITKTSPASTSLAQKSPSPPIAKMPTPSKLPSPPTHRVSSPSTSLAPPSVQTPPHSPYKIKPAAPTHPPPPLTLPPPQYKFGGQRGDGANIPEVAQQKTVLTQKIVEKPKLMPLSKPFNSSSVSSDHARKPVMTILAQNEKREAIIKDSGSQEKIKNGIKKKASASDSEDVGTRIITIAGENRGAIMELGSLFSSWRNDTKRDGVKTVSDGEEEGKGNHHHKEKGKNQKAKEMPMKAFMNSNVQGVNNCILSDTCYSHHDPGVHVTLKRRPATNGSHGFDIKQRGPDHHTS